MGIAFRAESLPNKLRSNEGLVISQTTSLMN